jgi:hypothetical protein
VGRTKVRLFLSQKSIYSVCRLKGKKVKSFKSSIAEFIELKIIPQIFPQRIDKDRSLGCA